MRKKLKTLDDVLEQYLQDPQFALSFLNQALADDDIDAFKQSLKDIIKVHGNITSIAKDAKISRGTLYKIMSENCDPGMGTMLKVFHALGYDLTVTIKKPLRRKSRSAIAA